MKATIHFPALYNVWSLGISFLFKKVHLYTALLSAIFFEIQAQHDLNRELTIIGSTTSDIINKRYGFPGNTVEWADLYTRTATDAYTAPKNRAFRIGFNGSSGFCPGEEIVLTGFTVTPSGLPAYSWSDGSGIIGTSATVTVTPSDTATYTLTYADNDGTMTKSITIYPIPQYICEQCIVRNGDFGYYEPLLESNPITDISAALPWMGVGQIENSSDHFHPDYTGSGIPATSLGFGSENDHTTGTANATGYAGIWTYRATQRDNYREYIGARLNCKLEEKQLYNISFWVSLADSWSTNSAGIGMHLSVNHPFAYGYTLPHSPQLFSTTQIGSSGWTQVSLTNYAGLGEEYITIGNFFTDSTTLAMGTTLNTNPSLLPYYIPGSYYFVDDVSITPVSPTVSADVPTACVSPGTPVTLTADGSPSYLWSWTDSAGFHTIVTDQIHVSPIETTTYIIISQLNCPPCGDVYTTYTITVDSPDNPCSILLSSEKTELTNPQLNLYPNPGSGEVWFVTHENFDLPVELTVYSTEGVLVHKEVPQGNKINFSFSSGTYFVVLSTASESYREKLIIINQ